MVIGWTLWLSVFLADGMWFELPITETLSKKACVRLQETRTAYHRAMFPDDWMVSFECRKAEDTEEASS